MMMYTSIAEEQESEAVAVADANTFMEDMVLRGNYLTYALEENPDDIFTEQAFVVLTYKFNHFCYEDFPELHNYTLFIYVRAESTKLITYRQAFFTVDQELTEYYNELASKYDRPVDSFHCHHVFLEGFEEITPLQFDICCGS